MRGEEGGFVWFFSLVTSEQLVGHGKLTSRTHDIAFAGFLQVLVGTINLYTSTS